MKRGYLFFAVLTVAAAGIMLSAEASEAWVCENGHGGNTGNYCTECGAQKPSAEEKWTCPNGHEGNTGNFCSECGVAKPVEETWTCKNGHEGNIGNFCMKCGAPKPAAESAPPAEDVQQETAVPAEEVSYDNPFPEAMNRFTVPFSGITADHQVALAEVLSHASADDEVYVEYESTGKASEKLAWDKYSGETHDLYLVYQNGGQEVYAYAYRLELDPSQRTEWASGTLFPNPLNAVSSVLWVESGEDNDTYSTLLDQGAEETDYEAVQSLIRSLDPDESAQWFSHRISMLREETGDGKDCYWVIFHNTGE